MDSHRIPRGVIYTDNRWKNVSFFQCKNLGKIYYFSLIYPFQKFGRKCVIFTIFFLQKDVTFLLRENSWEIT